MKNVIILLDGLDDWQPYCITGGILTTSEYLRSKNLGKEALLVINLSGDCSANSEGYYCSLLAQARGHKVIPGGEVINKLYDKPGLRLNNGLQKLCQQWARKIGLAEGERRELSIFFGQCREKGMERVARHIFDNYPAPILRVCLRKGQSVQVESIESVPLRALSEAEQDDFAASLDAFNRKIWRAPRQTRHSRYSLAILHDPCEKLPPSNKKALARFLDVARKMDIHAELITEEDSPRLMEFDALFIRATTSLHHYTYRLAQKADQNGMAVIDDPLSIVRCTNKVYLSELLERAKIPTPASRLMFKSGNDSYADIVEEIGSPFILKIPDGSFSFGVHKIRAEADFSRAVNELFARSAVALVQEYLPTDFDWRVGILNGEALFACKYYMARGHWQIYNHGTPNGKDQTGLVDTLPLYRTPHKVVKTALRAAGLIGKGLYGVDLKEVDGRVVVIEVNDNPSIDYMVEDSILGDELYYRILNHFVRLLELQSR